MIMNELLLFISINNDLRESNAFVILTYSILILMIVSTICFKVFERTDNKNLTKLIKSLREQQNLIELSLNKGSKKEKNKYNLMKLCGLLEAVNIILAEQKDNVNVDELDKSLFISNKLIKELSRKHINKNNDKTKEKGISIETIFKELTELISLLDVLIVYVRG